MKEKQKQDEENLRSSKYREKEQKNNDENDD